MPSDADDFVAAIADAGLVEQIQELSGVESMRLFREADQTMGYDTGSEWKLMWSPPRHAEWSDQAVHEEIDFIFSHFETEHPLVLIPCFYVDCDEIPRAFQGNPSFLSQALWECNTAADFIVMSLDAMTVVYREDAIGVCRRKSDSLAGKE